MKTDLGCKDCDKRVPGCHDKCASYFAHKLMHIEKGYEKLDSYNDTEFKDRYFITTRTSERGKKRAKAINADKWRNKNK